MRPSPCLEMAATSQLKILCLLRSGVLESTWMTMSKPSGSRPTAMVMLIRPVPSLVALLRFPVEKRAFRQHGDRRGSLCQIGRLLMRISHESKGEVRLVQPCGNSAGGEDTYLARGW
jgi:hypothetical protein